MKSLLVKLLLLTFTITVIGQGQICQRTKETTKPVVKIKQVPNKNSFLNLFRKKNTTVLKNEAYISVRLETHNDGM